jgi:hypothetical protein
MAYVIDDGTMDTVIVCDTCGREHRFNFGDGPDGTSGMDDNDEPGDIARYETFVLDCIEDIDTSCECEGKAWSVGRNDGTMDVMRFATHDEASAYIGTLPNQAEVVAGAYYIHGPQE